MLHLAVITIAMGQSQSTRRGTPSYRLPQPPGRNKAEDSDGSETATSDTFYRELPSSKYTAPNADIEPNQNHVQGQNSMKHSIPIVTVTGKLKNKSQIVE